MINPQSFNQSTNVYTGTSGADDISVYDLSKYCPGRAGFTIEGLDGDDRISSNIIGEIRADFLKGGKGNDFISASAYSTSFASVVVSGGAGTDSLFLTSTKGISNISINESIISFSANSKDDDSILAVSVSTDVEYITFDSPSKQTIYYLTEDIANGRIRNVTWDELYARTYGNNSDWSIKGLDTYTQYHGKPPASVAVTPVTQSVAVSSATQPVSGSSSASTIGSFQSVFGTKKKDRITGKGEEAVFAGKGNDWLTGFSRISADGEWQIPSILSGGLGNDSYNIQNGTFTIIVDAGGGKDSITAASMNINNIEFYRINQRDIWATDGNTSVIIVDPQGVEGQANRIETFKLGGKRFRLNQLVELATTSNAFGGDFTYQELSTEGYINFRQAGLNPVLINDYIQTAIGNNSTIG